MPEINVIAEYIPSRTITAQFIPVNFDIPAKLVEKTIQANGVYNASDDNADGYSSVTVVVPDRPLQIQELNVTPTTQSQTITVPSSVDGFGPVNVGAVTSSIDSNIQPDNIKSGVSILGVNGSVAELNGSTTTINPSIVAQTVTPTAPSNGFTEVTVPAVTSAIDSNIQPENIREGISILGTVGTAYIPSHYVDFDSTNGVLTKKAKLINLDGITSIASNALLREYSNCVFESGTHIDMSGIKYIDTNGCSYTFSGASGIYSCDLSGLVDAPNNYCCYYMFQGCTVLNTINLSKLKTITGNYAFCYAFQGCGQVTTINLGSLRKIYGQYACAYMCKTFNALKSLDLGSLEIIADNYACTQMFAGCSNLENINIESLVMINGAQSAATMFWVNGKLTNVKMSSLKEIQNNKSCSNMFENCTALRTLSFPALYSNSFKLSTTQWSGLISGVTGCTIHLPKNLDPQTGSTTISSLTGYPNFGGTGTVLAYDLPSTFNLTGADSVVYERNPKYDTETALAWRVKDVFVSRDVNIDWTPFYTSGTSDPQINDTLYSDSSCTTAITTIQSIA